MSATSNWLPISEFRFDDHRGKQILFKEKDNKWYSLCDVDEDENWISNPEGGYYVLPEQDGRQIEDVFTHFATINEVSGE